MRYMHRKGDFFILFLSILMVIAYTFAAVAYIKTSARVPFFSKTKVVGGVQNEIINSSMEVEKRLFFMEESARYAAYGAISEIGKNGGLKDESCKEHELMKWDTKCFNPENADENIESSFLKYFGDTFEKYKGAIKALYNIDIDGEFSVNDHGDYFDLIYKGDVNDIGNDNLRYSFDSSFKVRISYRLDEYKDIYKALLKCAKDYDADNKEAAIVCIENGLNRDMDSLEVMSSDKDNVVVDLETKQKLLSENGDIENVKIKFIVDLNDLKGYVKDKDVGSLFTRVETSVENKYREYTVKEDDNYDAIILNNYIKADGDALSEEDVLNIKNEIKEFNKLSDDEFKVSAILLPDLEPIYIFKENRKVVIIDAGHGDIDSGAKVKLNGVDVYESNINLEIAQKLRNLLIKDYDVYLTRTRDQNIPLEYRSKYANDFKDRGAILISLHVNSFGEGDEDKYAEPCDKTGMIVFFYGQNDMAVESERLAEKLQIVLYNAFGQSSIIDENFFMVRESKIPAVLIELGFICNEDELNRLMDDSSQELIANTIYNGVKEYFALPT